MLSDTAEHLFQRGINEYTGFDLGRNENRLNPRGEEIINLGFNVEQFSSGISKACTIYSGQRSPSHRKDIARHAITQAEKISPMVLVLVNEHDSATCER